MSINWPFSIIFLPRTKKGNNVECGIYHIVSKLRMEIRLGSKCHRQMSSLTSKLSLLSRWGNTRMESQPERSCRLSDWHILDAHIYQHFRKRSHKHQSLFVALFQSVGGSFVSTNPSNFEVKMLAPPDTWTSVEWARLVTAALGWVETRNHNPTTNSQV